MKKVITSLLVIIMVYACLKDEPIEPTSAENTQITTYDTQVDPRVKDVIFELRTGLLLPILDTTKMVINNYLLSGTFGYNNEQHVFNKDSISSVSFVPIGYNPATINRSRYNSYEVRIKYMNTSNGDFVATVYGPENTKPFKPTGENLIPGTNLWLMFRRETRTMNYYDTTFKMYKTKHQYTVMSVPSQNVTISAGSIYRDYIPSLLKNSSVFNL